MEHGIAAVLDRAIRERHQVEHAEARRQAMQPYRRFPPFGRTRRTAKRIGMAARAGEEDGAKLGHQCRIMADRGGQRGFKGAGIMLHPAGMARIRLTTGLTWASGGPSVKRES